MTWTSVFILLAGPQLTCVRVADNFVFIPHSGIVYGAVKKHFEHLQQLQFAHNLDGAIHHSFAFQEIPEILFGENDCLDYFAERNSLLSAVGSDLAIAVFDIEFILAQQPLAEMPVNLVDTFA